MAYFPFFIDLSAGDGLIVGGGAVALRKIEKLLEYGARLTVCAPELLPEIEAVPGLTLLRRPFEPSMAEGKLFVIAAAGDGALNRQIAALCREKHVPVNVVDDRDSCTFLFPALVKQGPLCVGISTGGTSPSAAVYWKQRIAQTIPPDTGAMLDYLGSLRETVRAAVPDEQARSAVFAALFDSCLTKGWPLERTELERLLRLPVEGTR